MGNTSCYCTENVEQEFKVEETEPELAASAALSRDTSKLVDSQAYKKPLQ